MNWQQEVEKLHRFFDQWYNAACSQDDLPVLEDALDEDFSLVAPSGVVLSRREIIDVVTRGYGQRPGLEITVNHFATLLETPEVVVGRYVERHQLAEEVSERVSLAVFRCATEDGRLRWVAVHETWRSAR